MELKQAEQIEYLLEHLPVGVAILDGATLRIRYLNAYLHSLLPEPWKSRDVVEKSVEEVIPEELYDLILPLLHDTAQTGKRHQYSEVPYEGFLEARGRTYWKIVIERLPTSMRHNYHSTGQASDNSLCITVEDVTNAVRSRIHFNAIQHISSAMAGPFALPQVLDRILEAVHEMVGSTRCAVLLLDYSVADFEEHLSGYETDQSTLLVKPLTITIAAQRGVHLSSQDWHPPVSDQVLLGRVAREGRTLIIEDSATVPDLDLPPLDDSGTPRRPGSVLCVPIYEPRPPSGTGTTSAMAFDKRTGATPPTIPILGTIEVYHRRTRGFPSEEVELLEQFAQQAGLAIQNARLFRRIDQSARAASRSARQRKYVMQAIPDGVVLYDPRWRIADVNYAARKLLGWSEDVVGLFVTEAMARSTARFQNGHHHFPQNMAELERRAAEGRIDEFKMIGADGQDYTIQCSYIPIRDDLGDTFGFIVIYHDVTEQVAARERIEAEVVARTAELAQRNKLLQRAQHAQKMERQRLESLLERLPSGVILVSAEDKHITVINRHAVQVLQHAGALDPLDDPDEAHDKAIGMSSEELFKRISVYSTSGSLVPYEERPLAHALDNGEVREMELYLTAVDGQPCYLLENAAPLRANDGSITNGVLVIHEITHLKMLERAREDFFTTMAHELKTPLANIRAHLSALLAKDLQWSSEAQQDFLQTADEQVERLVRMINQFLDASRVEAGALRLELEAILLPEMFEDLEDRLEALITSSQRHLQITLPPQLPAIHADYELIMSVLTNLLSNAFRYAPEGDTIYLTAELVFNEDAQPSGVTISVTDRGPGMTQEQLMSLFTRFSTFAAMNRPATDRPGQPAIERRRGTARWSPATGLGLYISRGIIEAHGSVLTVKSSPGHGATFAFTLPIFRGK
jgi:PAS domain S-box-containing protein